MKSKGFTLIELLVVVAIIGILATVVIASLSDARTRAKDAAIQAAVSQARATLEMNMIDNSTYEDTDGSGSCMGLVGNFTDSIEKNGVTDYDCLADSTAYSFYAALNTPDSNEDTQYFCADSTGFAGLVSNAPGGQSCN